MTPALTLILLALGGIFAAHVAFDRLARRYLIVSGPEYLLAGVLLGPQVSGVLSPATLESFAPFAVLALGWMGAALGMTLRVPKLIETPAVAYRIAVVESLATVVTVAALQVAAFVLLFDVQWLVAAPPALALGAIAVSSSRAAFEIGSPHLGVDTPLARQLDVSTTINGVAAVTVFGFTLSAFHPDPAAAARPLTTTEWMVVTAALGLIGGALFHLFVAGEKHVDRLFVALAGALILVSGAAAYLQLSPLLAAMFFGAMLVNTSRNREEIRAALSRVDRPLFFVLLVFAGASWRSSTYVWLPAVALFLAGRAAAKLGGARLAARANGLLPMLGGDWGRALLGQGGLAVAISLDYMRHPTLAFPHVVFTAAIVSVLFTELTGARITRAVARAHGAPAPA